MPTLNTVIDKITADLRERGLLVECYNLHLHKRFTYVSLLCHNLKTGHDASIIAKVNSDENYKLYVELD